MLTEEVTVNLISAANMSALIFFFIISITTSENLLSPIISIIHTPFITLASTISVALTIPVVAVVVASSGSGGDHRIYR